jgi:hypothetical protein
VELGAISNVVLIDHDGIYDPRLVNDRLLLGLKGIMSEFELATLRLRAHEAKRGKAQRGELPMPLPVGLVSGPNHAIELDPDARVQQAIRLVLGKFEELGSTRQVMFWLRREHVSLPVRRYVKGGYETEWAPPNYTRVHAIITNPFMQARTCTAEARVAPPLSRAASAGRRVTDGPSRSGRWSSRITIRAISTGRHICSICR